MKLDRYILLLILLILWQVLCSLEIIPTNLLPSPFHIILGLKDLLVIGMPPGHLLPNHILYSLYRVTLGFLAAALLGIPLGLLLGWSPRLRRITNPLVELVRPIPPLAWIPIAILWFGIGMKSAAFIIFLGRSFPFCSTRSQGFWPSTPSILRWLKR